MDITKAGDREMDEIRKRIGLAFQGGALIGSMSVGENICAAPAGAYRAGAEHDRSDGSHQAGTGRAQRFRELQPLATERRDEESAQLSREPWRWIPRFCSSTSLPRDSTRSRRPGSTI